MSSNANSSRCFHWIVTPSEEGVRLDHFLRDKEVVCEGDLTVTRARLQKLIERGLVTVDAETSRAAKKLREGQHVSLEIPPPAPLDLIPEDMNLNVQYEDDYVVVVDKPKGIVVHPSPGHSSHTLVNGLLFRHTLSGGTDPLRPGIVHRLDKDTSGLMVVAKREEAHAVLAKQFHDHTVDRQYRALASGSPPDEGEWATLFGRSPYHRRAFSSRVKRGKKAVTRFSVNRRFNGAAELSVRLRTGRTHQVRVHCYDHGFAVLGDRLYTPKHLPPALKAIHDALGSQALHAEILGFDHPATGEHLVFQSAPPTPYEKALDALKVLG